MKKNLFVFALVIVAVMCASCNKEKITGTVTPDESEYQGPTQLMTFNVTTEDEGTKTTLDAESGSVSWADGDKATFAWGINVGNEKTQGTVVSSDLENNKFSVELPAQFKEDKSMHLYGIYPSSVNVRYPNNGGDLYVTVPKVQDGTFASASIAIGKAANNDLSQPLTFYNLCGLLQVKIEDPDARKFVVCGNEIIAGEVSVSGAGSATQGVKSITAGTGAKEITVNIDGKGIYYVAVLPTSITGLYIGVYNDSNELIGDKVTVNTLEVARKQIKKLGTIKTGFGDRYYVKPTATGSGDGSSWDDAANLASLNTKLLANNTVLNVYMAAGTYSVTAQTSMGTGHTACVNTITGGYPSDATGYSLKGRSLANETILKATSTDGNRIWILQRGSWTIDGIIFQNAKRNNNTDTGSALVIEGDASSKFNVLNCKFSGNENTGTGGGGAVRVSGATVNMSNCEFTGNKATSSTGKGGAIYVNSTGTLNAQNCLFTSNTAAAGKGAVYVIGKAYFKDCSFTDNVQTSIALASNGVAYADRCYFSFTKDPGAQPNAIISTSNAPDTKMRINNSVFAGAWGDNSNYQIFGIGDMLVVNSTILGQSSTPNFGVSASGGVGGTLNVINCIIGNAGSTGTAASFGVNAVATANCYYTLYSSGPANLNVTSSLAGIIYTTDANKNFPAGYTWYTTSAAAMFSDNQSNTIATNDCRGLVHYYEWNGVVQEIGGNTFTKATLAQVEATVEAVDADFKAWASLGKDILGNTRNSDAVWPGSYEAAGATPASIENLNVK